MSQSVFVSPEELTRDGRRYVLALGVFDGVHLGHQKLCQHLLEMAKSLDAVAAVMFFHPFPRKILHPEQEIGQLTTLSQKEELLKKAGVSAQVCFPFSRDFSVLSPEEFLEEYFFHNSGIAGLCVGENWRFGCGNRGEVQLLKNVCASRNLPVEIVQSVWFDGSVVSSTRIRLALAQGEVKLANSLLGRPYELRGVVSGGLGLAGRSLSCPTANLAPGEQLMPLFGVYAGRVCVNDEAVASHPAIVYIGDAPTIPSAHAAVRVEVHLLDGERNLYGSELKVELLDFLRGSQRFSSEAALAEQISRDVQACLALQDTK